VLNLVSTKITRRGLLQLKDLKNLQSLYLFQTNINRGDWSAIKKDFPRVSVDFGGYEVPLLPEDTVIVKPPPIKN
jgi:hypothetical protein